MKTIKAGVTLLGLLLISVAAVAEDGPTDPLMLNCDVILAQNEPQNMIDLLQQAAIVYWVAGFLNGYGAAEESDRVVLFERGFGRVVKKICAKNPNGSLSSATTAAAQKLFAR